MLEELLRNLNLVWLQRRREVNASFNRTLPFADYVVNRWEKTKELGFGEGSSIYDSALVLGDVGSRQQYLGRSLIDGSGGLVIGSYCSISAGVQIYSHDTAKWPSVGEGRQ